MTTAAIDPALGTALAATVYQHPVMVTEAAEGTPATVLGRLTTLDLRTAVYAPAPHRRQRAGVAIDALEALGKRSDVTGKSRHDSDDAELLGIWLTAHRTRHLVSAACQYVPAADLLHLVTMTQATPTNLLFAADHGFAQHLMERLHPTAPVLVPWPDVPDQHPAADRDPNTDAAPGWGPEPTLPAVEYWTFYATARRQLTPAQFQPVHDLYCDTLDRLNAWLQHLGTLEADLTVGLAHESLRTHIEEQTTFDRVTVVVRAAQAAYHRNGWFLDVDERELRNGLIRFPTTKTTPDLFERLRAYREPTRAAAVALYLAGATPQAISDTTIDDLAQWRCDGAHPVANVDVPEPAAPYLRAVLLAHANDGANPEDPAFPGGTRRVNLDVRQAATDLDLNIGDANLNETKAIGSRRIPESIVRLEHIA